MVNQMESNVIMLNSEQRAAFEKFVRSGVHGAMEIRRARAILALDRTGKKDHLRVGRICEAVGLSRQGLNEIRKEFLKSSTIEEFLTRKKRETPPVPAKITGDVEAHIIALACSEPPEGHLRWTVRLLAEKAVELQYVDGLSAMSVSRLLKKRNISLI
jgi:hypothetical protein